MCKGKGGGVQSGRQRRSLYCQDPRCSIRGHHYAHLSEQMAMTAALQVNGEPRSHREAMASPMAHEWRRSELSEIHELEVIRKTWEQVLGESWMHLLGSTWSYKLKRDEHGNVVRYKSRFCVQGFSQQYGIDFHETHASVARHESIRTVLALGASLDLEIHNMDVTNAYCQADVK